MPPTDPFAARMLAQITLIERYRADVLRREGRRLDSDSAALEWIARYAEHFPSPEQFHCRRPSAPGRGCPQPASFGQQPRPTAAAEGAAPRHS
ncbi:hypothetical protein [Accumulibacter sp.]|jgi:hypothetical protein|uniref:hypothetical protein n=1 Tax=Accumulibacter sp. TaxID=2053492 RepID=UPI001AC1A180|nr:hypothetical protein [Accumulibacter sp.]MBN8454337.1 hypothetical protein [Accumulibacter sp.]MBO3706752.1 hypothetical protein [Candidatus Accumulibacter conexus]